MRLSFFLRLCLKWTKVNTEMPTVLNISKRCGPLWDSKKSLSSGAQTYLPTHLYMYLAPSRRTGGCGFKGHLKPHSATRSPALLGAELWPHWRLGMESESWARQKWDWIDWPWTRGLKRKAAVQGSCRQPKAFQFHLQQSQVNRQADGQRLTVRTWWLDPHYYSWLLLLKSLLKLHTQSKWKTSLFWSWMCEQLLFPLTVLFTWQ